MKEFYVENTIYIKINNGQRRNKNGQGTENNLMRTVYII